MGNMVGTGERNGQEISGIQQRKGVHTRRWRGDGDSLQTPISGGLGGVFEGKSGGG